MADINQYPTASEPSLSDLIVLWSSANGDTRKLSLTALKALLVTADSTGEVTQYAAPSATGFTVTVSERNGRDVWVQITPGAGYAAGSIVLPAAVDSIHGQMVRVSCTQSVGTLTVSSSGGTVAGAPTALSANGFFTLKFDGVLSNWQRVA